MNTYKFIKTSTAGNRTGFIIGKNSWKNRSIILESILTKKNLEAEQYAFLWKDNQNNCYLNMAGQELCGGAILAAPSIIGKSITTNIYTVGKNFKTNVTDKTNKQIFVQTSLPREILKEKPYKKKININQSSYSGFFVNLTDIAYFVTEENIENINIDFFKKLDQQLETITIPALGVIQILVPDKIKPIVWVKSINTIIKEQGCTTGSIAAQSVYKTQDGSWQQPSNKYIRVKIIKDQFNIEANIQTLSEGNIYIN